LTENELENKTNVNEEQGNAPEVKTETAAETKTVEATEKPKREAAEADPTLSSDNGKHDDFPWELGNKVSAIYTSSEKEELAKEYEKTLKTIEENTLITGSVASITNSDVVLNIGYKSDGLVSLSEFRDLPDMKIGDPIEVYVVKREDEKGHLVLSRRNAKLMRAWDNIVTAFNDDKIVEGLIIHKTKGGLIVNVFGLETFLPGSQIDVKPIIDYDSYVGKTMEFKVVKINETIKNAVVSHKALIESDLEAQRSEIIGKLEKGQVLVELITQVKY